MTTITETEQTNEAGFYTTTTTIKELLVVDGVEQYVTIESIRATYCNTNGTPNYAMKYNSKGVMLEYITYNDAGGLLCIFKYDNPQTPWMETTSIKYCEDGKTISVIEKYERNNQLRITKTTRFDSNENLIETEVMTGEYSSITTNSKNQLIRQLDYHINGSITETRFFDGFGHITQLDKTLRGLIESQLFDINGHVTELNRFSRDEYKLTDQTSSAYNELGQLITQTFRKFIDGVGQLTTQQVSRFTYDAYGKMSTTQVDNYVSGVRNQSQFFNISGQTTELDSYSTDGIAITSKIINQYNSSKKLGQVMFYTPNGINNLVIHEADLFTYQSNGALAAIRRYDVQKHLFESDLFQNNVLTQDIYSNGLLQTENTFSSKGQLISQLINKYDKAGKLLTSAFNKFPDAAIGVSPLIQAMVSMGSSNTALSGNAYISALTNATNSVVPLLVASSK